MGFINELSKYIDFYSLGHLGLSALIGIVVGIEREIRKKPTGVKTLMVIAVSSTLLTLISIKSIGLYHIKFPGATVSQDPLRLPAQIVSGVSFLGAGLILKRSNDVISGLTTAAITWSVASLGIAVGANFISEAIMATLFFLIGIELIPRILEKITGIEFNEKVITMKLTINKELETKEIMKLAKQNQIKIKNVEILDNKENPNSSKVIKIRGYINKKSYITNICDELSLVDGIKEIDIRE